MRVSVLVCNIFSPPERLRHLGGCSGTLKAKAGVLESLSLAFSGLGRVGNCGRQVYRAGAEKPLKV